MSKRQGITCNQCGGFGLFKQLDERTFVCDRGHKIKIELDEEIQKRVIRKKWGPAAGIIYQIVNSDNLDLAQVREEVREAFPEFIETEVQHE